VVFSYASFKKGAVHHPSYRECQLLANHQSHIPTLKSRDREFKSNMASTGGTILITGANGGLGSALVSHVISSPGLSSCHGIYTVRDADNAPELGAALSHSSSSHNFDIRSLDLTNLDKVRQFAHEINTRVSNQTLPVIRALILNAGFQDFGKQTRSSDGYDTTFSANYLGHWLLSLLLLQSMDKNRGRIIIVGSQSHE
jgi:NAD(P)-dependent dehydrogenase (short-subunit alcohol dehydrogenase family)